MSTQSHQPLLWKNRDITNPDQAVFFFTDGKYRYIGLVYAGDSTRVWAGINEKGFGIMNSTSGNIGSGANRGPDDGEVMKYALQNCASIEEFGQFLDSTNKTGRRTPSNFGVLDSTGEAAIFEAGGYEDTVYFASNESLGFMLRANYSMSGDTSPTWRSGYLRYLRGMELAHRGFEQGGIDAQYIMEQIAKDFGTPGFDPYPLPFYDTVGAFPFGFLPTTATISRYRTRASVVIVGKGQFDRFYRMWTILGEASVGIAVPLFFDAGAVPAEMNGPGLPELCALAKVIRNYVYSGTDYGLSTFLLAPIYENLNKLEKEIFNRTAQQIAAWRTNPPTRTEIIEFEQNMAQQAVDVYEQFLNRDEKEATYSIDLPGISVSPNPARNSIKFNINRKLDGNAMKIYNILGKMVEEFSIEPSVKTIIWTPKNLSSGVYYLVAGLNSKVKVKFYLLKS